MYNYLVNLSHSSCYGNLRETGLENDGLAEEISHFKSVSIEVMTTY